MELEFDKEIDALLRKGLSGRSPTGDALAAHLDADKRNASNEALETLYMLDHDHMEIIKQSEGLSTQVSSLRRHV
jgi:hypothetical protein